jgi:cytochrome P450
MSELSLDRDLTEEMFDVAAETAKRGRELVDDPYAGWAQAMARDGPIQPGYAVNLLGLKPFDIWEVERPHYAVLSFNGCNQALVENDVFSSSVWSEYFPSKRLGRTILHMGGDEHRQYRNIVQPLFTRQKAVDWWQRSWVSDIVGELIRRFQDRESVDLSKTLCARLPMHTITRAFGIADEKAVEFRRHLVANMAMYSNDSDRAEADAYIKRTLREEIAARRDAPGDDLISVLLHGTVKNEDGASHRLSEEEIFSFCRVVLTAGGGTTFRQLGITLVALLSNPDQLEAVKNDRSLIERAIHESVRWNPTLPIFYRLVTEDTELAGYPLPKGAVVDLCLGAANRDPGRWSDPHTYDLFRPLLRHVGFAGGPHTCLGMFVAQSEMTVAINALLDTFPDIRFDPDFETPRITGGAELRGVSHLNVRLR